MYKKSLLGKNIFEVENMSIIQKIALVITIIGAINWGLVGIFDFNLVEFLFSEGSILTRIIYILVCISGLFNVALLFMRNRHKIME